MPHLFAPSQTTTPLNKIKQVTVTFEHKEEKGLATVRSHKCSNFYAHNKSISILHYYVN